MKKTFTVGALGYGLLEILWRGKTHPSMLLCGGVCLCTIKKMCEKTKKTALLLAAKAGKQIGIRAEGQPVFLLYQRYAIVDLVQALAFL